MTAENGLLITAYNVLLLNGLRLRRRRRTRSAGSPARRRSAPGPMLAAGRQPHSGLSITLQPFHHTRRPDSRPVPADTGPCTIRRPGRAAGQSVRPGRPGRRAIRPAGPRTIRPAGARAQQGQQCQQTRRQAGPRAGSRPEHAGAEGRGGRAGRRTADGLPAGPVTFSSRRPGRIGRPATGACESMRPHRERERERERERRGEREREPNAVCGVARSDNLVHQLSINYLKTFIS